MSLLQRPDTATQLGARGLEYARGWSAGALAEKMLDFYQRTIEHALEVTTRSQQLYEPNACLNASED